MNNGFYQPEHAGADGSSFRGHGNLCRPARLHGLGQARRCRRRCSRCADRYGVKLSVATMPSPWGRSRPTRTRGRFTSCTSMRISTSSMHVRASPGAMAAEAPCLGDGARKGHHDARPAQHDVGQQEGLRGGESLWDACRPAAEVSLDRRHAALAIFPMGSGSTYRSTSTASIRRSRQAPVSHGGFTYYEAKDLLREVARRFEVVGVDFVEVSPPTTRPGSHRSSRTSLDFIGSIFHERAKRRG